VTFEFTRGRVTSPLFYSLKNLALFARLVYSLRVNRSPRGFSAHQICNKAENAIHFFYVHEHKTKYLSLAPSNRRWTLFGGKG
jgi:hypothetical protein